MTILISEGAAAVQYFATWVFDRVSYRVVDFEYLIIAATDVILKKINRPWHGRLFSWRATIFAPY